MDKSCFYKARLRDSVTLPFLLMEVVGDKFASSQDTPLEELLNEACVICYGHDHAVDLESLAKELHSVAESGSTEDASGKQPPKNIGDLLEVLC